MVIVDPVDRWAELAGIARDIPFAGSLPGALQPRDRLAEPLRQASMHVGELTAPREDPDESTKPLGRPPDWLDELLSTGADGFDELLDREWRPVFAPVAVRRFSVDDVPVVQFVFTVAPPQGR